MKKILFSALAAMSLVACVQEQVMDVPTGGAITFENAFVDNATKTTDNIAKPAASICYDETRIGSKQTSSIQQTESTHDRSTNGTS